MGTRCHQSSIAIPKSKVVFRGSNSVGRVTAFQAVGRGFESRLPLKPFPRPRPRLGRGRADLGFRIGDWLDVLIRCWLLDVRYSSGCLLAGTPVACVAQLVEHFLGKEEVTGSIPVASSNRIRIVSPVLSRRLIRLRRKSRSQARTEVKL